MAILTRYSSLVDQTSTSSSRDYIETPKKTASKNSCKHLRAIQRSDRKLWPFWPVTQVWPTRPLRHRVGIPYQPYGKWPPEMSGKIWAWSNGRIKCYGYFNHLLKSGRPDLLLTELGFHINPKYKSFRKLVQKFEGDLTVGSKVTAILTRYADLADQTCSSMSSDSIATLRKTASKNSCQTLRVIQWSDRKVMAILTHSRVLPTRPPRHRVGIPYQPQGKELHETRAKI